MVNSLHLKFPQWYEDVCQENRQLEIASTQAKPA